MFQKMTLVLLLNLVLASCGSGQDARPIGNGCYKKAVCCVAPTWESPLWAPGTFQFHCEAADVDAVQSTGCMPGVCFRHPPVQYKQLIQTT